MIFDSLNKIHKPAVYLVVWYAKQLDNSVIGNSFNHEMVVGGLFPSSVVFDLEKPLTIVVPSYSTNQRIVEVIARYVV